MSDKINIFSVVGGTLQDQEALLGCYFQPKPDGLYYFHDKNGKEKSTAPSGDMHTGKAFQVIFDGLVWTITDFKLDRVKKTAHGHWTNTRMRTTLPAEDPTFQGQVGGNVDADAASYAKA